jgi:uncharacterized delta-60 repeat protein
MRMGSKGRGAGRHLLTAVLLATVLSGFATSPAAARPGQLDRSFGTGGIAGESLGPHYANTYFSRVSQELDGSLLATRNEDQYRYSSDGALDVGFAPRASEPEKVQAVQADGKLLEPGSERRIKRLNPDGSLDSSFHGGESEPVEEFWIADIDVLPSGKILVSGPAAYEVDIKSVHNQIGLTLLNADGTIDRGFGKDGTVELRRAYGVEDETLVGVALQPDGGALVVSPTQVVRVGPDGSLDRGYGHEGKAPLGDVRIADFEGRPDGGLALAGTTGDFDFFVAHLTGAGALDPSYSNGSGIGRIDGGDDNAAAVSFEADGSILVGGATILRGDCLWGFGCSVVPAVARFDPAGRPDAGFGTGGLVQLERMAGRSFSVGVHDLVPRRGGGAILAGGGAPGGSVAFLAALLPGGALDPGFGSAGIVEETWPVPSKQLGTPALAVGPGGKLFAAVGSDAGPHVGPELVRYREDGTLDRSFGGGNGYVPIPGGSAIETLAVDRFGRPVLLLKFETVVRLTRAGEVDHRFNEGKGVRLRAARFTEYRALAPQDDGKILVAGTSNSYDYPSVVWVARLLSNGQLDPSFGKGGYATVGCPRRGHCAPVRVLVSNHGIVVAGTMRHLISTKRGGGSSSRMFLARLLPDGRPDLSFGRAGRTVLPLSADAETAGAVLSHGRVLVAGRVRSKRRGGSLIAAFGPEGHLDPAFGREGISRDFPPGVGKAKGIILAGSRLIVEMRSREGRPLVAFHRDGRLDRSYRRLPVSRVMPKLRFDSSAVVQEGKVVFGWIQQLRKEAPPQLRLTRLTSR